MAVVVAAVAVVPLPLLRSQLILRPGTRLPPLLRRHRILPVRLPLNLPPPVVVVVVVAAAAALLPRLLLPALVLLLLLVVQLSAPITLVARWLSLLLLLPFFRGQGLCCYDQGKGFGLETYINEKTFGYQRERMGQALQWREKPVFRADSSSG